MANNNHTQQLQPDTMTSRFLHNMIMHVRWVIVALVAISVALVVGGVASTPDEEASFSPGGEEFDTAEIIDRTFKPSTTEWIFVIEDDGGDVLDQASLFEWKRNSDALRADADLSDELSRYFDDSLGVTIVGLYSLADAVDEELRATGIDGLASATDNQTKQALSTVLSEDRPTALFRDMLSVEGSVVSTNLDGQQIDLYTSPAFLTTVRVDRATFPVDLESKSDPLARTEAEQDEIDATRDVEIEKYARDAQDILRGDEENIDVWGLAIDASLTSDESFTATIPFLLGAFVLIFLLVGALLRSYWAAALAGVMLGTTLLWARMISNLAGFEESIILDVIVPIATISFGVDFMIHAVGRCREELAEGRPHRSAFAIGIATVGGALVLALATSSIAFGSNASSGIEGVIQFGFGAAIALGAAFVMLGVFAPMFLLRIEEMLAGMAPSGSSPRARVGSAARVFVASLVAGIVTIMIIAAPFVGAVGVALYTLLFIAMPLVYTRRKARRLTTTGVNVNTAGQHSDHTGSFVAGVVRIRFAALALISVITVAALVGAFQVGSRTDPEDFLPSNSDMVTSINKALRHSGSVSPGGVLIFIEGEDLADPRALQAADSTVTTIGEQGGDLFVQNPDGTFAAPTNFLDVARAAVGVEYAAMAIESSTGVAIADNDSDGFPDTKEQVEAVFSYGVEKGIPAGESNFVFTPDEVRQLIASRDEAWTGILNFPMQGFGDSAIIESGRKAVEAGEAAFLANMVAAGLNLNTSISGTILTEQLALDAVTSSMVISVPLAMVLCVVVAGLFMRSAFLAAVSVVPIALVIVWLLGFMYAFGFNINIVTATITAISVGVGIDYSIHFTMRFREELRRTNNRLDATRAAASGTGTALMLSGATSIVGFLLLALAPMPIFAAYGLLTAVMIALSLLAALTVLPSLLYMVTPGESASRQPAVSAARS